MSIYLIIGIIVLIIIAIGWFINYKEKILVRAFEDVEKEYKLSNLILETKIMLSKNKFGLKIYKNEDEEFMHNIHKIVSKCPKCKSGYLTVDKNYVGLDDKYHRYPVYNKFLKCLSCDHTEGYYNLKSNKQGYKEERTREFIQDFNQAYSI